MDFSRIPIDLFDFIFIFLSFEDLTTWFRAAKRYYHFLRKDDFWRRKITFDFPGEDISKLEMKPIYCYISLLIRKRLDPQTSSSESRRVSKYERITIFTREIIEYSQKRLVEEKEETEKLKRKREIEYWTEKTELLQMREKKAKFYRNVCDPVFQLAFPRYFPYTLDLEKYQEVIDFLTYSSRNRYTLPPLKEKGQIYNSGSLIAIFLLNERLPRILIYFHFLGLVYLFQDQQTVRFPHILEARHISREKIKETYQLPSDW